MEIRLPSKKVITRPHNLIHKIELHPPDAREPDPSRNTSERTQPEEAPNHPPRHPMVTRSKARLIPNAVLLCFSILLTIPSASSMNTRCPDEVNINKTVLYATSCVSKGIAIARYEQMKKETMCWFPVSCPMGHVRFDVSTAPTHLTLCGDACKCPQWTNSCSFSISSRTALSNLEHIPQHLREYKPDYVCSFSLKSTCDSTKKIGFFNQVQLFDDNLLLIEELTVSIKDYLDKYDFVCVDRKGWMRRPNRHITGTSHFCEKHECRSNARLFCAYDSPLALLVIDESQDGEDGSIPIKAWGTVMKPYYGYPAKSTTTRLSTQLTLQIVDKNHNSSTDQRKATRISVECIKGGLLFSAQITIDILNACINDYCVYISNVMTQSVLFPTPSSCTTISSLFRPL